mmetsp:Transcript_24280/g.37419  ORF Transcript_24280/g.37419 Transcript_24280/m.37419 type:complete len:104 (-) Transcript_24280:388-699(-)
MNEANSPPAVSVQAQFTLPSPHQSPVEQKFDASNCKEAVIGKVDTSKKLEPGDFSYSGMHDQGLLPAMKEGGPYALLIGCVDEAQKSSNELLTSIIQDEKAKK